MLILNSGPGNYVINRGKRYSYFGGNNYLGLAGHPDVKKAAIEAVGKYGVNFSASRRTSGTADIHLELEQALKGLTGQEIRINCSGRTDTGVHARGQVVHFDLATRIPLNRFKLAWNGRLPEDVRILTLQTVSADFDARFSATGKEYRFSIWNAPVMCPLHRRQAVHVRAPLDLAAMRQAAAMLEGKRDFAAFSANPHREIEGTVRTLWRLTVLPLCAKILGAVAQGLSGWFAGAALRIDLDKVPALAEDRMALWCEVSAADWLTADEKKALLGVA